ncbi:hypothetical protein [Stenotrophomonas sp.]|uniref:hypothetical protein n=1 Tax=Stenotrophomonas sp. TaxID=69392 RepID=UPI0028AA8075|nr:hypothetical protein [Stenotrophomonas sp.]
MPRILVLAGVNGAGKSSLLGAWMREERLTWFNPDAFTRELEAAGYPHHEANAKAWEEGKNRLVRAMVNAEDYAFESTLGATTIPALLREAMESHEVHVWFCGLSNVDLHIERVSERVAQGGHDIPEHKIRERFDTSRQNLVALLGGLTTLHLYDNSVPMEDGVAEPRLVLELEHGIMLYPADVDALVATPTWAVPIMEHALRIHPPAWLA